MNNENILIEYEGVQHFKPTCYGEINTERAKRNLKRQRHYDWLKRKYAKVEKIPIVCINYWDDVSKKLDSILSRRLVGIYDL